MSSINDITGDSIQTKAVSDAYRDNYDLIFGKKNKLQQFVESQEPLGEPFQTILDQNRDSLYEE